MNGKLISSNGLFLKTLFATVLVGLVTYHLITALNGDWQGRNWIMALFEYPALGLAVRWAFGAVHPVYFDDSFLYYTKYGKQYKVACEEINDLSVSTQLGISYGQLSFYNNRKKVTTIHFTLASDEQKAYLLLQQLQTIIRHTKPGFEVDGLY